MAKKAKTGGKTRDADFEKMFGKDIDEFLEDSEFDIDSIEPGFVPGTGWPEPGGLMPREALKMVGLIAAEGLCGMEVVEVSPPYDHADITSLMALRLCVDVLGSLVAHGKMGAHKSIIDKPFVPF